MSFLDDYEPVEDRLAKFWADHPDGRVWTEPVEIASDRVVFRAAIYREADDEVPWATGYAHEVPGQGNVNKTSALENCETSALGRALANAGYAPKGARPSREEMSKTAGQGGAASTPEDPQSRSASTSSGGPGCAACGESLSGVAGVKRIDGANYHPDCAPEEVSDDVPF